MKHKSLKWFNYNYWQQTLEKPKSFMCFTVYIYNCPIKKEKVSNIGKKQNQNWINS